jgi:hypothetical protein
MAVAGSAIYAYADTLVDPLISWLQKSEQFLIFRRAVVLLGH